MRFEFATASRIVFGNGALSEAAPAASRLGNRALVITSRSSSRVAPLLEALAAEGIAYTTFQVDGEPTTLIVEQALMVARKHASDLVLGFGGGSVIDTGKAVSALANNPDDMLDYLEVIGRGKPLGELPLPYIAIPTTAGTGSEVTRNAVIGSPDHQVKVSLRSPHMLPRVALVDPELTYDLPPELTASTGMDALTQLIEPYVSVKSNPLIDSLCLEGIRRAARALPLAYLDGGNRTAREDMSLASLFGGLALANAALGAVHGFAGPLGGMFPAPHGAVCARLLPFVMEANLRALEERLPESEALLRYREIARILAGDENAGPLDGVVWVKEMLETLQIPGLSTYGVTVAHFPELVEKSARASSMKGNPVQLTNIEMEAVLKQSL